jgi:hypothetical protein
LTGSGHFLSARSHSAIAGFGWFFELPRKCGRFALAGGHKLDGLCLWFGLGSLELLNLYSSDMSQDM